MGNYVCKHCTGRFQAEYPRRYCKPECCVAAEKKRAAARTHTKTGCLLGAASPSPPAPLPRSTGGEGRR
jgi:hypothetical protein